MPFKRILLPLFALLVIAVTAVSATAATYNPTTQFSLASNPNGVWSYGYGSVGTGSIALYTHTDANQWDVVNAGDPLIGVYVGSYACCTVPPGDLVMHPGDAESLATILVFTAPDAGTYSFGGLFERDDTHNGAGNGVAVSICKDTTDCSLYTSFISSSTYLNNAAFNLSTTLNAGETLDFEVARTGGSYNYDTTGLQLNITSNATPSPTPEPSSFVLLGTGVAALFGAAKRRMWLRAA